MRSKLTPILTLATCLSIALAAPATAESYLGSGASAAQVKRALLNTRSLSRPKPVTEAAAAGTASRAGKRQAAGGKKPVAANSRGAATGAGAGGRPRHAATTAAAVGGAAAAGAAVAATTPPDQVTPADGDEAGGPASFAIFFDLNSSTLRKDSLPVLDRLGVALASPDLKDFRFVVEGHTDASGSEPANQLLSENRARTVRDYLVEKHQIDPARLEARGRGADELYDADNPFSPKNRRVRFVNPDAAAVAAPEAGTPAVDPAPATPGAGT